MTMWIILLEDIITIVWEQRQMNIWLLKKMTIGFMRKMKILSNFSSILVINGRIEPINCSTLSNSSIFLLPPHVFHQCRKFHDFLHSSLNRLYIEECEQSQEVFHPGEQGKEQGIKTSTRISHGNLMMASFNFLKLLLLLILGCSHVLRADPVISPTVKSTGGSSLASVVAGSNKPTRAWDKPYFDDVSPRNVTAIVGQMAELNCHVKHPGDRTVSWMRKRDLHILTSSIFTYTGDGRFSVKHPEVSDEWRLRIEYVQPRDAGIYECQVNTEPKMNLAFMLKVEAAQAKILGPEDVYVKKGSTISLTCTVNVQSTPPSSVSWHHGSAVVDFDSPRGGVSLETEKTESGTTSKLLVTQARLSDSGNYTCIPSNANPASVMVHVLNGEHPAAMQHGGSCGVAPTILLATLTLLVANLLR